MRKTDARQLVMGIDLGTSSAKTVVMDAAGTVVASASAGYRLLTPAPGWVEQRPQDWWNAVRKTIRAALLQIGERHPAFTAADIASVAFSGQMNGAVFVDTAGRPLRDAMLWLDGRSRRECDLANQRAGDVLRHRALHVLNPINTLAKILWAKDNEPHVYATARYALVPKDWLRFKLTGVITSEVTDDSVTGAFDLYTRQWSGDILDRLEVRHDLFPPVYESPAIVGTVTAEAARLTGLETGTPVCGGGGDMACMAVGSGAIRPGVVGVGIGTAGHAIAYAETIDDSAFNQLWPMCHAVPGAYFWLGCSYTGGGSLTWLSEQLDEDFERLTRQAAQTPPGSEDLFFMPWLAGTATPHPDAAARGGWIGLTLRHTKGHMVRALLEGVAFDLRQSLECFARLGLPADDLRLGEGGVKSQLWRQILVDTFGRDGRLMELKDASAIGAALIAGVGAGVFDSFGTACDRAVRLGDNVVCDLETSALYNRQFARYRSLYPTLKPWFQEI
ncbi:MAG: xylulokinase [candidate division Zixibacteria bacterium]|nr:xylulokinase [candidate division Zixibacteria bacterium]